MDKGPWKVPDYADDRIDSDDFTHDASLILYGDFRPEDKRPYLEFIANELNSCASLHSRIEDTEGLAEEICEYFEGNKNETWLPLARSIQRFLRGEKP